MKNSVRVDTETNSIFEETHPIFVWERSIFHPYFLLGCKGVTTATASVLPKENVELLSLVEKGKIDEARKYWCEKFLTWNDSAFYENWQWAHKYAPKLNAVIKSDAVAPPQARGADYQAEEIKALLRYQKKI